MSVGALVLAAGSSERFGGDKRKAVLANGRTVLASTIHNLQAANLPIQICVDAQYNGPSFMPQAYLHRCDTAAWGMGRTLAEGILHIPAWNTVLIVLGDMPWVQPDTYRQLAQLVTEHNIVAPCYQKQRGNPVCFGSDFFPELRKLSGDRGASSLLQQHQGLLVTLEVDDPGVLMDIDTPPDLNPA